MPTDRFSLSALSGADRALEKALRLHKPRRVRAALAEGANPDARLDDGTPLWFLALPSRNAACLPVLLAHGVDARDEDEQGRTALHVAAACGGPAAVRALLAAGFDPNGLRPDEQPVPAVLAAQLNRRDEIELLLAAGSRTEGVLQGALEAGHRDLAAHLLAGGAPVNEHDLYGRTALHALPLGRTSEEFAATLAAVEALLAAGADPEVGDARQHTMLHRAAGLPHGAPLVARLLRAGARADRWPHDGITPLHVAVNGGALATVRLLLEAGADALQPAPSDRLVPTPALWAQERAAAPDATDGHRAIAALLRPALETEEAARPAPVPVSAPVRPAGLPVARRISA